MSVIKSEVKTPKRDSRSGCMVETHTYTHHFAEIIIVYQCLIRHQELRYTTKPLCQYEHDLVSDGSCGESCAVACE